MRIQSICLALAIVLVCAFARAQWVQAGLEYPRYCHREQLDVCSDKRRRECGPVNGLEIQLLNSTVQP
jgi:hypothetical protein